MIGSVIGHYRVVGRLGEGGMGEVYLVDDLKLHRRAALKLIKAELTRDPVRRERFLQEATLAASVDHPHITAIYDIDEADGRTYIAMEYVEGRPLRELLKSGPLPSRRALDLALQIADALAKVHERGVVHRDLKPENVLVAADGYAKLIDFGIAKLVDPLPIGHDAETMSVAHVRTADGIVLGTMGYMAPEQVRGEVVDARSDIFSFGAVLYEMLSGTPPFRRPSAAETIGAVLAENPPPVRIDDPQVEPDLQRIVRKCLMKDAASRYQSLREVAIDLREVRDSRSSGSSSSVDAHSFSVTSATGARPDSRLPFVVAAVALVLAAGAAAWLWMGPEAESTTDVVTDTGRPSVAVMTFEVAAAGSELTWLGKGLPSMLVTGLAQTPDLEVIGTERLRDAARQLGAGTVEAIDASRTAELLRRAGARYVVNGGIVHAGSEIRIDARVEDLTTGAIRWADSVRGTDPLSLADELSARIRRGLDVPTAAVQRVADVTSGSIEAYRAYMAGLEAVQNVRVTDGGRLFSEAVRLDPSFALAHVGLARIAAAAGRDAERRAALAEAAKHLDRLVERDQWLVRAELAIAEQQWDQANGLLERLIDRYPETEQAYLLRANLVRFYGPRPDTPAALALLERGVRALPYSAAIYNAYGYTLLESGRMAEALDAFTTYVKLRPAEPNAIDSLGEGQLVAGDFEAALASFTRAFAGGHVPARRMRGWTLAVMGRTDDALADVTAVERALVTALPTTVVIEPLILAKVGRFREAQRQVEEWRRLLAGDSPILVVTSLYEAWLALERGDCAAARQPLAEARRALPGRGRSYTVLLELLDGTCAARQGRLADARARLARARQEHASGAAHERWWVAALEGEIALAAGDPVAAERAFAAGEPERKMIFNRGVLAALTVFANNLALRDGRARAAAAQGHAEEAVRRYRELLTPGRDQKWTAVYEPRYVLAIARLLDKLGRRDEARQEYLRFLEYWKQADPGLPELVEARARVS